MSKTKLTKFIDKEHIENVVNKAIKDRLDKLLRRIIIILFCFSITFFSTYLACGLATTIGFNWFVLWTIVVLSFIALFSGIIGLAFLID